MNKPRENNIACCAFLFVFLCSSSSFHDASFFFFIVPIISFDISLRIYLSTSLSSSKSFFFLSSLLRLHCSSPCQKFLPFSPVYFYKSFLFLFVRIFSKKRKVSVKLFFCWRREDWFPEYGNFSNFITRGGS